MTLYYKVTSIDLNKVNPHQMRDIVSMYPIKIETATLYGVIGNKKSILNPSK